MADQKTTARYSSDSEFVKVDYDPSDTASSFFNVERDSGASLFNVQRDSGSSFFNVERDSGSSFLNVEHEQNSSPLSVKSMGASPETPVDYATPASTVNCHGGE